MSSQDSTTLPHPTVSIIVARKEHLSQIIRIYEPFVRNSLVSLEYEVPSLVVMEHRIEKVLEEAPWLVCISNNLVLGYAYASKHRERNGYQFTRELSVYVLTEYEGLGIASALYSILIGILKWQGYVQALAGIVLPNEKSVRFHEKMGFCKVGVYKNVGVKYNQFVNVGWWELSLNHKVPDDIIPWKQLTTRPEWEEMFRLGTEKIKIR